MAPGISGNPAGSGQQHPSPAVKRPLPQEQGRAPKTARRSTSDDPSEWDEEQHRDFVTAVFEIGLRNSSPAVILENMSQKPKSITSERVKSKLQKYRKNKDKSKQEFLEEYDAFFQRAKAIDSTGRMPRGICDTSTLLKVMGSTKLLGGDAAAFISYAINKEQESEKSGEGDGAPLSTKRLKKGAMDYVETFAGSAVPFPVLTESEKNSSLGVSMSFVMGLFLSMTQHITQERELATAQAATTGTKDHLNHPLASAAEDNSNTELALKGAASLAMGSSKRTKSSNSTPPVEATDDQKPGAAI
jgi:SHAQKYF class myb-like DNA-binding protein